MAATRARTKAEAARAKASYAERKTAMMRKKAEVEADLFLLKSQKEATAASTEAAIYEAAADIEEGKLNLTMRHTQFALCVLRSMFRSMQWNNISSSFLVLRFYSHP